MLWIVHTKVPPVLNSACLPITHAAVGGPLHKAQLEKVKVHCTGAHLYSPEELAQVLLFSPLHPTDYTYHIYSLLLIRVLIPSCSFYIYTITTIKKLVHVPLCKASFRWAYYRVHSYKAHVWKHTGILCIPVQVVHSCKMERSSCMDRAAAPNLTVLNAQ